LLVENPQVLNALDMAMADGLRDATRHVAGDATVRAVIIRGAVAGFGFSTTLIWG